MKDTLVFIRSQCAEELCIHIKVKHTTLCKKDPVDLNGDAQNIL